MNHVTRISEGHESARRILKHTPITSDPLLLHRVDTSQLGDRAFTLVDLGHHLPNTNSVQMVATLMMQGKLGGFHFNDSKFGDDDLTVGAMKPYQLFLIFNELVAGM
jgi:L-rhamnose isomerase